MRIEHRESVHGLEQAGEIGALHGQQLRQRLAAGLLVLRQDHGLHVRDAILGEEHVLGAAQADAFGAELARGLGIARNIGIGAHAEAAAELVRPAHERRHDAGGRIGVERVGLAGEDLAGGTVERQPVAFLQRHLLAAHGHADFLALRVDVDVARAGHAGRAHAAANHGRVAGHAAARSENALGHFHAVNVVRLGFGAHQDHGSRGGLLHGFIGGENHACPPPRPAMPAVPWRWWPAIFFEAGSSTGCRS